MCGFSLSTTLEFKLLQRAWAVTPIFSLGPVVVNNPDIWSQFLVLGFYIGITILLAVKKLINSKKPGYIWQIYSEYQVTVKMANDSVGPSTQ